MVTVAETVERAFGAEMVRRAVLTATADQVRSGPRVTQAPPAGVAHRRQLHDKTTELAIEYLTYGGRRFRPYLTLAVYQALANTADIPDQILLAGIAIEAFHKASLIHDDIEDDEEFRYGRHTLHENFNLNIAINTGDYLLGLGYMLLSHSTEYLSDGTFGPLMRVLTSAHTSLASGQGAELFWKELPDKEISRADVYEIYARKTSPAFEAAIRIGVILAGYGGKFDRAISDFAYNLGIAFQIRNDLKDFAGDRLNKNFTCRDICASRPTLLLAIALERATPAERRFLLGAPWTDPQGLERTVELYNRYQVPQETQVLCGQFAEKATVALAGVGHSDLRALLGQVVKYIFRKESLAEPGR